MPGNYTLELELFSLLNASTTGFEIWADGALLGGYSSTVSSSGSTISITVPYGGALPTSLEFRFNDTDGGTVDQIEIRSVIINDRYVNTGNYLSTNTLNDGGTSTVTINTDSDFLFDDTPPPGATFTTGATQTFTVGNDFYNNTAGTTPEVFDMLGGRDVAYLGSGNDTVSGGAGNDILYGRGGDDLIYGDLGNDLIKGGIGNDTLFGGDGDDRIHGNDGDDEIHGGDGADRLHGQDGADIITGGLGADVISGGIGNDFLFGGGDNDQIVGGAGNDTLDGGAGIDTLFGGTGDDYITGGLGGDLIIGGSGADTLHGNAGADIFYMSAGDFAAGEEIYGGADTDRLILTQAATVDFTTGILNSLEDLTLSTGNDNITLGIDQFFSFTTIDYRAGTDTQTIDVSGTNDVTALSTPAVTGLETGTLIFSAGVDDFTSSGEQFDALTTGVTSINTLAGADVINITSTSANLNVFGSVDGNLQGLETISASGAGSGVVVSVSGQTEGFTLTGSANNDTLTGGAGVDVINGGNGNDILTGLAGGDTINGGDGDDTILGGDANDILNGGAGNDTIYGATIIGESGVESVVQTNATTWHTVTFSAAILNPVVKMSNMTNNDGDFYSVRVRNLTETGFEWQIDEFDYLDGSRVLAEEVSWLAVAEGTHTLDNGSVIQAGTTTATNEAQTTVTFNSAFGTAPVVLTQVISDNDSAAVVSRNRNITTTNFRVNMLEEEDADGVHATEDIGWIAIEAGGSAASGFLTGRTAATVDETVTTISFGGTFANTPVFVHDQQTTNGGDTSWSQADGVTTTTADVLIGEEQSRDLEINHPGTESVGYFALNEGLLTEAGGGDNTITGGAGVDTLFGGDGADTFIFELLHAFVDNDILADFSAGEGDILDISDLITSGTVNSGNVINYLNFDDSSGTDTIVEVDSTGGGSHTAIATINGVTGLDEVTLFNNGNIIA